MKKLLVLSVLLPLLAACSTANDVVDGFFDVEFKNVPQVPYSFKVDSFLDYRAQDADPRLADVLNPRSTFPFQQHTFLSKLVGFVNGPQYYDYENATLRIELRDYAAFKEGSSYTVSMYVDMTGMDNSGKVITTGVFSCLAEGNSVTDYVREMTAKKDDNQSISGKTPLGKVRVWDKLYEQCANDLAYQFNLKVNDWNRRRY